MIFRVYSIYLHYAEVQGSRATEREERSVGSNVKDMSHILIDDQRKRQEEIAEERHRCEMEVEAHMAEM